MSDQWENDFKKLSRLQLVKLRFDIYEKAEDLKFADGDASDNNISMNWYGANVLTKDVLQAIDDHLEYLSEHPRSPIVIVDNLYCTEWPQKVNK